MLIGAGGAGRLRVGASPDPWNLMRIMPPKGSDACRYCERPPPAGVFRFPHPFSFSCEEHMRLTINGQERDCAEGSTLGALLEELRLSPSAVVVERNRDIVPRESLSDLVLADGDRLEIVRLVGGG